MKMYELTLAYEKVLEMAEELDDGALRDTLDSITDAIDDKAENIAKVIKQLEADADTFRQEEVRLAKRRRTVDNNVRNLKRYLQESLEQVGTDRVNGKLFTVSIQNNPSSVDILDESKIELDYFDEQPPKLDKKAVLESLKNGIEMEGARIKQTRSVRIR